MRAHARGITLIEILIAVSLLVLIVSLAAPAVIGASAERRFRMTTEQIGGVLTEARSEAVLSGEPLEAIARSDGEGAWRIVTRAPVDDAPPPDSRTDPTQFDTSRPTPDEQDESERIRLTLHPDLRFADPETLEQEEQMLSPMGPVPVRREGAEGVGEESFTIALFLPDGAAATGDAVALVDEEGRRATLGVRTWTGDVVLSREDLSTTPNALEAPALPDQPAMEAAP